jgi:hypothetical protein
METLFNKSAIRIGIDTIKIKLDSISTTQSEPTNQLINKLKSSFDPDVVLTYPDNGRHFVKDMQANRKLSKIYKTGKYSCMIEIFGMCQTVTNFKLTDYHETILSIIGNMQDMEMTFEKIDVAQDFFYPHDRSFVFNRSKIKSLDFVDFLNYQSKYSNVYLNKLSMTTITVPNNSKILNKLKQFAFKHKKIKSPSADRNRGDCYCRWVNVQSIYTNIVNYAECEENESSHFQIKINDLKIYCQIRKLFDGTETYSSDCEDKTKIHIKTGSKKISNIKYDKSKRDKDKKRDVQGVYKAIIEEIADIDDEYNDLMEHFQHTRVESRFFQPCVTKTQTKPLNINSESSYDKLLDIIKEEIEKMTIFIVKPDISADEYLRLHKDLLNKKYGSKRIQLREQIILSNDYGRILEVTPDAWNDFENQIDVLKSKFIPSNNPIRRIIHRVGGRS